MAGSLQVASAVSSGLYRTSDVFAFGNKHSTLFTSEFCVSVDLVGKGVWPIYRRIHVPKQLMLRGSAPTVGVINGVKPIPHAPGAGNVIAGMIRVAVVGGSRSEVPASPFPISANDAFAQKDAEVENGIEAQELALPRLRQPVEGVVEFLVAKIIGQAAAVQRTPTRHGLQAGIVQRSWDAEPGKNEKSASRRLSLTLRKNTKFSLARM